MSLAQSPDHLPRSVLLVSGPNRGMRFLTEGGFGLGARKTLLLEIELVNENIDHANRFAFGDLVFKRFGEQGALRSTHPFDKSLHQSLPQCDEAIFQQNYFVVAPQMDFLNQHFLMTFLHGVCLNKRHKSPTDSVKRRFFCINRYFIPPGHRIVEYSAF